MSNPTLQERVDAILHFHSMINSTHGLDARPSDYNDAIKLVFDLHTALKASEESKWISVDDRLPEDTVGFPCIVYLSNDCTAGSVTSAHFVVDKFCIARSKGWNDVVGVTHWQPLPTPPKGE